MTKKRGTRFAQRALRAAVDTLEPRLLLANVSINEILAVNVAGITDEDGAHSDWIELRNSSGTAQSLGGFYLSDDPANLTKWQFPSISVPANGYVQVWASDKDRAIAGSPLHTNFHLDRNGETLFLVNPNGTTIESQLTFGDQEEDISFGPDPGTAGNPLRYFSKPTPLAANVRSEVVINEIHYDPDIKTEAVEFVELYNPSPIAVDLSGAAFTAGIDYTFPAGTSLGAGKYLVLAQNLNDFSAKFKSTPFAQYAGSLSNEGETVTIRNASGGALDRVDYNAGFPWPTVGEAPGYSIQLINPDFDNQLGGNWRSAAPTVTSGTPVNSTIFPSSSAWHYRKGRTEASNPISDWRQLNFTEDATWATGNGPVGVDPSFLMGTSLTDMPGASGYASVFLRRIFSVANPATLGTLRVEAAFDDGFSLWINGNLLYRTPNMPSGELAATAACGCVAREDNTYRPIYLPVPQGYLQAGNNVIAVQFHNVTLADTDAFFDARMISTQTMAAGMQNTGVFATNAPPAMRQVENFPKMPASNVPVTITAKITDPNGVQSAILKYQLVDPGSYIALTDAAYNTSWTNLTMRDDGTSGDVTAGDGIYTVIMPASLQVNRRLIRYRIQATDSLGASITAPYADDQQPNFAYYVYNGASAWTGAAQPGVTTPVTYSSALMNSMPNYILISKQTDVETATWYSQYTGEDYPWVGTLVYNGEVYDHVHYRARGGVWRYSMGKNMWKFDFNRNHSFQAYDNYGQPYATKWDKLNFSAIIQQGNFWHRGEQGLFESVGFKLFNLAGVAAPLTNFVQFRVVDNASETGATQYDGDLWGMYLAIEQQDGNLLDQHGLPDGNLYKMEAGTGAGGGVSNNQGPTQPSDNSDLVNYTNGYLANPQEQWYRDNVDLNNYYSYRATLEAFHHYDIGAGKNYFYYHNPETNKWDVVPWDLDLTWADNMCCSDEEPFKRRILPSIYGQSGSIPLQPNLAVEFRNRTRELRDLLFNPDQMGAVIDEMAAKIYTPGQPSWVDIDRAMWDYNPVMIDASKVPVGNDKAGQGRYYMGNPSSGITIPGCNPAQKYTTCLFSGMVTKMKNYIVSRDTLLDNLSNDSLIPNKPAVTYTGPALFPIDGLTFNSTAFSDTTGTFAAMKWRIGRITNTAAPGYDPKAPKYYEINSTWESPEITTFNSSITIPPQAVEVGGWYRVRVKMKDSTGRWSRWSDAVQFQAGQSPSKVKDSLRITELNYHPASPPPTAVDQVNDDYEFIEIKNIGSQVINLLGAEFTAGIDFTFPDISLQPGESLVLAKNADAFASRYVTTGMKILSGYTGTLDNGGEQLILKDALGQTILNFNYDDIWYPETDGSGKTLQIIDPTAATGTWSNSASWRASLYNNGTPGADEETLAQGSIVINEVLSNSETAGDWIELYNTTPNPINIGGWYISDSPGAPTKFKIPAMTIGGNSYIVFNELTDFGSLSNPNALVPFAFNDTGDDAVLSSANAFGVLSGYDHEIHFDAADPQVTFARYTNTGGSAFAAASSPTPSAANAAPRVGPIIINEIMYNPPLGGDEFIELLNITTSPVNLYDPANPQNTWKFTKGITFSFPQGVSMPAGGYLLLVAIDPATFRSKYSIPANVPIYQYTGLLENTGEQLTLAKPAPPDPDPLIGVPYVEIDRVDYDNTAPWPTAPDGGGASLGKVSPTLYGNDPQSWEAEANGGTPGALHNDTNAPTADIVDVAPDPRTTGVSSITINFSEPVQNFDISDLILTRNGGANLLTASQTLTTTNNVSFTLNNLSGISWVEGAYTLTLNVSDITDLTAHPLSAPANDSFTVTQSTLNPGNNPNTYVLKMNATNLDIFENNPGPNPTYRVKFSDINALTINTGSGADALTLDFAAGNPIPTGGLFFNGGAGTDSMTIMGNNSAATYRPSATTSGNGNATIGGRNFNFTGMEPATMKDFSSFTFVTPNATDTVTIDSPSSGQTRIFGNSSGITFFSTIVMNTPLMILDAATNDGAAGNDAITIGSSGTNTNAGRTLRILAGAGTDTLTINGGNNYLDLPPTAANLSLTTNGSAVANLSGAPKLTTLFINNNSRVNLISGGANALKVGSSSAGNPLQIDSTAVLDLTDNDLLIQVSPPARDTAFAAYLGMVQTGKNGPSGPWSGFGIISSSAATNLVRNTTLAIMPNDTGSGPIVTTFAGQSVDTSFILAKYTYTGDSDLDGDVDADDYARIDAAYAGSNTIGGPYRNGDINYSGSLNSDDYFEIDRSFSTQSAPLAAPQAAAASASVVESDRSRPRKKRHHPRRARHQHQSMPSLLPRAFNSLR